MKAIYKLSDLEKYGILPLTGEACRVSGSGRILCDLTEKGAAIVADCLGLLADLERAGQFRPNWNTGAVASFMLPGGLFEDLAAWCLLSSGCDRVVISRGCTEKGLYGPDGVYGHDQENDEDWDRTMESVREFSSNIRTMSVNARLPGAGTRCEHQMSGRTE